MTFSRAKADGWTNNNAVISATQINTIDTNQANAVDGAVGGVYTALLELNNFKSSGLRDSTVTESLTFDTTSQFVETPQSLVFGAVTGTTENIRDLGAGVGGSHYDIDDSAATGNNKIVVKTNTAPKEGEVVWLANINPSAHVLDIDSEGGGANPIAQLVAASNILWVKLSYRAASGWIVVAKGDL